MRLWLSALALLAGCVTTEDPPAEPTVAAAVESLSIPACATMGAPFDARVVVSDLDARAGATEVILYAQQYGRIASAREHVQPGAPTIAEISVSIERAGPWDVYATAPTPHASAQRVLVAEGAC